KRRAGNIRQRTGALIHRHGRDRGLRHEYKFARRIHSRSRACGGNREGRSHDRSECATGRYRINEHYGIGAISDEKKARQRIEDSTNAGWSFAGAYEHWAYNHRRFGGGRKRTIGGDLEAE